MAKVIFEFDPSNDDWLINIHHNAVRQHTALVEFAEALRAKTKHAQDRAELEKWLPLARLFKEHVSSDLHGVPIPTDFGGET